MRNFFPVLDRPSSTEAPQTGEQFCNNKQERLTTIDDTRRIVNYQNGKPQSNERVARPGEIFRTADASSALPSQSPNLCDDIVGPQGPSTLGARAAPRESPRAPTEADRPREPRVQGRLEKVHWIHGRHAHPARHVLRAL